MPIREIDYPNTGGPWGGERGDPGIHDRVETGPTKFGDDWCGLFMRGDDAFGFAMEIGEILAWYNNLPDEHKKGIAFRMRSLESWKKLVLEEVVEK